MSTSLRAYRAHAAMHDRDMAAAYALGMAHGRQERRRLMVAGAVAAVVLMGRRHLHPLVALAWGVLVLVALSPLVLLAVAVETMHRQHGRWHSWPRTGVLAATWTAVVLLAYVAARTATAWPLVAAPVALAAWAVEHGARVHGWRLPFRGMHGKRETATMPNLPRAVVDPYRVVFTSKAEHLETRRYGDGRTVTVDTRTGEEAPDPFPSQW